jgi:hypothetical protein
MKLSGEAAPANTTFARGLTSFIAREDIFINAAKSSGEPDHLLIGSFSI